MSTLFIKDNFFSTERHKTLCEEMLQISYKPPPSEMRKKSKSCYWHEFVLSNGDPTQIEIGQLIQKYFYYEVQSCWRTIYTMVGPAPGHSADPHTDKDEGRIHYQCLIYIMGDERITNGTGFFTTKKIGDKVENTLSNHIGFKPNRAIFFDSDIKHTPLHWSGESSFRYSIGNFFK